MLLLVSLVGVRDTPLTQMPRFTKNTLAGNSAPKILANSKPRGTYFARQP
jgi:hypothetical protein